MNVTSSFIPKIRNSSNLPQLQFLKKAILAVVLVNIIMSVVASYIYPPLYKMPNSVSYSAKLIFLLLLYIPLTTWTTNSHEQSIQSAIRIGAGFGLISALIEILHISIENFGHL